MSRILFITGTDTDVGKTMASLLVLHALRGSDAIYLKPVQTGCADPDHDSDPAFIHRYLPGGLPGGMTPAQTMHSLRPLPKAPLYAGPPVDMVAVKKFITTHAANHELTVVEGAGGILVPITPTATMLDLALAVDASILVVGRAGLGTINHTLLTLQAIATSGGHCRGVLLMDPQNATQEVDRRENIEAIHTFSGVPVFGVIGRLVDLHTPQSAAMTIMQAILHAQQAE